MTDFRALCAELADSVELLLEMRSNDRPMQVTEDRLNRARTALAQPEPQGLTNEEIEEAAKLIHASMRFAVPDKHYTCGWVEHGNSLMQDEARRTARAVLARWGRFAIEPEPEVHNG